MPGSPAATAHGNRGGGWLPPGETPGSLARGIAAARAAAGDAWPSPTRRDHIDRPSSEFEWALRARMADARRHAGLELNALDDEALAWFPEPPGFCADLSHLPGSPQA